MANKRARLNDLGLSGSDVFFGSTPPEKDISDEKKDEPVTQKPAEKPKEEPKQEQSPTPKLTRATFYFYPDQLDELEEIRLQIKRDHKIKTDKSAIVRIAVNEILENYRKNKDKNPLKSKLQSR